MVTPQTSTHHHRMTSETAAVNPEQHGSGGGHYSIKSFPKEVGLEGSLYVCVNAGGETGNTSITNTGKKSGIFRTFL